MMWKNGLWPCLSRPKVLARQPSRASIGLDVRRTERPLPVSERAPRSRSYTLAKTIVHGLLVLMT